MVMNIQVESQGSIQIVRIKGKITFEHCPDLRRRLDAVLAENYVREVRIDFKEVPYIDSSGVGEILRLFKRMMEIHGEIVLLNPNEKLKNLFLMYRFNRFIRIHQEEGLDPNGKTDH